MGTRAVPPGVKPPSNAKFKNDWSYTSTLPTCLHKMHSTTLVQSYRYLNTWQGIWSISHSNALLRAKSAYKSAVEKLIAPFIVLCAPSQCFVLQISEYISVFHHRHRLQIFICRHRLRRLHRPATTTTGTAIILTTYTNAATGTKHYFKLLCTSFNHLTPNGHYMGRTTQLTSRCCILYIYSTNIHTEYFKHAA